MRDWLVAADDRTGALEVAAELSRWEGNVQVTVGVPPSGPGVVDLGSRALPAELAAARAAAVPPSRWAAHKIDSTLRGNWPREVIARAAGRRVLLVPAWPAMGRTCLGGVVHVHGRRFGAVRDRLAAAVLLPGPDALDAWLRHGDGVAVVDVADTRAMADVAGRVADAADAAADLLVAGPAGPIGAVATACRWLLPDGDGVAPPAPGGVVLVVVGSASEVAAEQVARLRRSCPGVDVLAPPPAESELDVAVAQGLARAAAERAAAIGATTVVVVGGDTAAAFLGDGARLVGGYAAPGMPYSTAIDGTGPVVVTKAGAFGGPDALADLVTSLTPSR